MVKGLMGKQGSIPPKLLGTVRSGRARHVYRVVDSVSRHRRDIDRVLPVLGHHGLLERAVLVPSQTGAERFRQTAKWGEAGYTQVYMYTVHVIDGTKKCAMCQ